MNLSVAIITKNEEKVLGRTLASVVDIACEIIIVDSGSNDKTEQIAIDFGATFYREDWKGYGPQKNSAIEKCKCDWILSIDADEELTPELTMEISEIIKADTALDVYKIKRLAVIFGREIRHGGWSNSQAIRLFRAGAGAYNDSLVHENFITRKNIGVLHGHIRHHTYLTVDDYFARFNRYSTEGAKEFCKRRKKTGMFQIVFHPLYKFVRDYILQFGFLDGLDGLFLASASALYTMTKYYKMMKIYKKENSKDLTKEI